MKSILENNRKIAKFLGAIEDENGEFDLYGCEALNDIFAGIDSDDPGAKHFFKPEQMPFYTSWTWLMCVAKHASHVAAELQMHDWESGIYESLSSFTHNIVIEEIVAFIDFYNINYKKPEMPHTPGPWISTPSDDGTYSVYTDHMHESMADETLVCYGVKKSGDVSLIVDAPKMAYALALVVRDIEEGGIKTDTHTEILKTFKTTVGMDAAQYLEAYKVVSLARVEIP